jgi:radical SAM superfamily enzyme YgiQ (UPF0313 family)
VNILLIQPAKAPLTIGGEDIYIYEPLALEYLAAGLENDHQVRILDMRLDPDLDATLAAFSPDIVGITAYTVHVNIAKRLFEHVKAWNPAALTVVGGHHATVAPEDFVSPYIDLVVRGEGVFSFREIVDRCEKGRRFDGIPGVAWSESGRLVQALPPNLPDLDALPFPARHLTAAYRSSYYSEWMRPLASLRTSKGCPHRCNFCAMWKVSGGRYFRRAPEAVVEELAGIEEPCVFFADDESLVDVRRMSALAQLIKEAGIRKRYFLYGRSDTVARNPELLTAWKEIGLERVFMGLEFFRDEDLAFINKGSQLGDAQRAVKVLKDLDIEIYASFMLRPEYTAADFRAFRDYCRGLRLAYASFSVLTPLPGTDFYDEVEDRLLTRDYEYFDFIHTLLPTALPMKDFYEEFYRLLKGSQSGTAALRTARRYRPRDLLATMRTSRRVLARVRGAYKDYEQG